MGRNPKPPRSSCPESVLMAKSANIPTPAVRRLSLYLRQLEAFLEADRATVSSRQLGHALGVSDAQVRKDLAYFGQFGYPGVGYRVAELMERVRGILGTDRTSNILLVGAGNVGRALASYRGFLSEGSSSPRSLTTTKKKSVHSPGHLTRIAYNR